MLGADRAFKIRVQVIDPTIHDGDVYTLPKRPGLPCRLDVYVLARMQVVLERILATIQRIVELAGAVWKRELAPPDLVLTFRVLFSGKWILHRSYPQVITARLQRYNKAYSGSAAKLT